MADIKISALNSLAGADLVAADVVAVVDDSASETKKLTVSDLIANGVTLISDATIPSAKILFSAGSIDTAELAASAVETAKINDSAVTAAKLANNSSVTLVSTLPASGDFIGQIALDTDDNTIVVWSGSEWLSPVASGSINVVNGSTSGIVNITTSTTSGTVTVSTTLDDSTSAAQFLAGPVGAGGSVGYRAIVSGDLPTATSSAKGAVQVNGSGLTLSGDEIQIDNTVTANSSSHHLVQYDANGLVTAGRDITAADLPAATDSTIGGVAPGTGLEVTADGDLNHENSVTAGTYTKVTVDAQGHVSAGDTLAASDVPDIDAAKITTGTFATARLANDAVTGEKLADQSVAKFGGAGATDNVVTFPDGDFQGQFFFDEKNEDLYIYTGESFLPITVISGNLVNAGTYNADTNLLSSVTTAGSAAGFTSGNALPDPASGNLNYYVVVDTSGTGSGNAPAVALAPPDMLISLGAAESTFQLIDVSNAIAGQTASNISVVSTGNIAATDVQAALQELDTEKLALAGGTMTGNLNLGEDVVLTFEGATDNAHETTLTVVDPTADRTLSLPNATGTLVSSGDTGSVTSAMIADGAIVNADINASAEIAVSKLANGSARQLLQTDVAGTGVEFTSNVDVPGTLDVTGAATLDSTLDVTGATTLTGATTVTGVINADGKVKFPAGSASAPSFYSGTDDNTGLFFSAADEVAIATAGVQRLTVDSNGRLLLGTTTEGEAAADKLTLTNSGDCGLTIRSGAASEGKISFSDGTSGADEYRGYIQYEHTDNSLRFGTNASEVARFDSSGRLLLGTSSARAAGGSQTRQFQIEGTTYASSSIQLTCNSTSQAPTLNFGRSRGTSVGSSTVVQDGDDLGFLTWSAADGTDLVSYAAQIHAQIDGTPGSNDTPGRLIFSTTADGNAAVIERLRITSTGAWAIEGASNYGTSGQVLTSNGNDSPTWQDAAGGSTDKIEEGNTSVEVIDTGSDGRVVFTTENTERFRIDSAGRLLVGTGSSRSNWYNGSGRDPQIQLEQSGNTRLGLTRTDDSNNGPELLFGGTRGSNYEIVSSGDEIGEISFQGADGSQLVEAANIKAEIDGTPGADDMPGRLVFSTTGDGLSSPTERMRLDSSGHLLLNGGADVRMEFGTHGTTGTNDRNFIRGADESLLFNVCSGGVHVFENNGTEVGRIDSSGNLDFENAVRGGTTSSTGFFSGDFRSNATAGSGFGALYAQNNSSGGRVWTGAGSSGAYTSEIFEDGSAKFDGSVSIGGDAAANTIDEYEEGTWTPSIGGNATYTAQEGNYIKIGHLVLAHFRLGINTQGTGNTVGSISGLPYNSAKASQNCSNLTWGSLGVSITYGVFYVGASSSQMYFSYSTGATASLSNNPNIFTNGASINGTMIYYAA